MTTWLTRWFALHLLVLPFVPAVADDPDDAEIARLVKQLGSGVFKDREAATKRLTEIGEPALATLDKATSTLEVRRRAESIIAVIENKLYVEQRCLIGHTAPLWTVSVSADGKRLLTSSEDKTLRLWDADTGKQLQVFEGHTGPVWGAALSLDGKRVLSGSDDGTVRLWDAAIGKELRKMTGHTGSVGRVAFGSESQAISGGADGTLRLWDLNTGRNTRVFTQLYFHDYCDKAKLAATVSPTQTIRLWNLETGKEVRELTIAGLGVGVVILCFSPDGKRLLSLGDDARLRLWDVETGKELKQIIIVATRGCIALSPDGKRFVMGGYLDNSVRVLDIETGKELLKYEGHTGPVRCVAFFPDGKRIASASYDGTARIWRAPR